MIGGDASPTGPTPTRVDGRPQGEGHRSSFRSSNRTGCPEYVLAHTLGRPGAGSSGSSKEIVQSFGSSLPSGHTFPRTVHAAASPGLSNWSRNRVHVAV